MTSNPGFEPSPMPPDLQRVAHEIKDIAKKAQGDSLELLALLRMLEGAHREVCEGLFQESLPDNRRALYSLLKDIEAQGGWPYIHRMRLHSFLTNLTDGHPIEDYSGGDRESETSS
jgi:hypothetical protein